MVALFLAPIAEWRMGLAGPELCFLPACPRPFQPRDPTTFALPLLKHLQGLFKLVPPGGAVTRLLQRRKQTREERSSHPTKGCWSLESSPCVLSHSHPLRACVPHPDPVTP